MLVLPQKMAKSLNADKQMIFMSNRIEVGKFYSDTKCHKNPTLIEPNYKQSL